jgi:hypothetical protein
MPLLFVLIRQGKQTTVAMGSMTVHRFHRKKLNVNVKIAFLKLNFSLGFMFTGLSFKTLQIHNLWKMDIFHRKL